MTLVCPCVCSNDAFDASTGVDVHKVESVVNLTGNRTAVLLVSKLFLLAGLGLLGTGIAAAADARVSAMLAAAIVCGYVYQGPPFRCECATLHQTGKQQVLASFFWSVTYNCCGSLVCMLLGQWFC